jgi:triosephosphate isomerase
MKVCIPAANWKANLTFEQAVNWIKYIENDVTRVILDYQEYINMIAAVPYVYVKPLKDLAKRTKIYAQNVSHVLKGAYTGEVTISMLKSINCDGVILGHSERRNIFNETDELINRKVLICQDYDMPFILCVGENLEQRQKGLAFEVIKNQLNNALKGFSKFELMVLAYEPVWAIGTGVPMEINDIKESANFILQYLKQNYKEVPVLYGGSVEENTAYFATFDTGLSGVLVGSKSLDPVEFERIITLTFSGVNNIQFDIEHFANG